MFARTVTLAFTGASGMPYGLRLLECLLAAQTRVYLLYSPAAQVVAKQECDLVLSAQPREAARMLAERYGARAGQHEVFAREDWLDNLIERAADVMLKERRPRVLDHLSVPHRLGPRWGERRAPPPGVAA
jgi:3-polyprenyl-4-hydroxybenzoate decarboxylase